MDLRLRNCVKFRSPYLKSRVTGADIGAVPAVTPRSPDQIMKTRKRKPPVGKRASRPAQRRGPKRRAVAGRKRPVPAAAVTAALSLAAECTVAEADSLKTALVRLLPESRPVSLHIGSLRRIDTAGVQLLAAFARDRRAAGRRIEWLGRAPVLDAAATLLGLRGMLGLPAEDDR